MAQSSGTMTMPVPVVGQQHCCPDSMDLAIVRKAMTVTPGNFVVTNSAGDLIFKVKGKYWSAHSRRVLVDASGNPIVTLMRKYMSAHSRWDAFRGESSDMRDHIFTARKSSMIQFKTKLDVFLANNRSNEQACDFKVEGTWSERSCVIYAGESSTSIVAKMHKKTSMESVLLGKDKFMVTVYPNIDYAFIVALIVILYEINHSSNNSSSSSSG